MLPRTAALLKGTREWRRTGGRAPGRGPAPAAAALAAVLATAALVAGCSSGAAPVKVANAGSTARATQSPAAAAARPAATAGPTRLLSVSPAGGSKDANGGAPITVTLSGALTPGTPLPTISPKIAGHWALSGATATFTPSAGFLPRTRVTVSVPGGRHGMTAAGGRLRHAATVSYTTGSYSPGRLQQVLAELGYLPLTWTAASGNGTGAAGGTLNAQVSAAYDPPAGTFTFDPGYPSQLTRQWTAGRNNELVTGAVRAFEDNQGLTMDGVAGPQVWSHLLTAAAADTKNPDGYTYALASQDPPHESLQVWHDGKLVLTSAANTGIPASSTADGTYPVYERLQFQVMRGTNPDGSKYADPVYWVAYFNGGDAVHYFNRASYGYYQSLGCVELPWTAAKQAWPYLTYGTLVTVTGTVA